MAGVRFAVVDDLPVERVSSYFSRRTLIGKKEMISWVDMKAGVHSDPHSHTNEQAFWILSGKIDFLVGGERRTCGAGEIVLVDPDVMHEMWFLEDTRFVTFLSPVKQDLVPGAGLPDHLLNNE
jgi:quercetin dioxygenase-like cupin family protein